MGRNLAWAMVMVVTLGLVACSDNTPELAFPEWAAPAQEQLIGVWRITDVAVTRYTLYGTTDDTYNTDIGITDSSQFYVVTGDSITYYWYDTAQSSACYGNSWGGPYGLDGSRVVGDFWAYAEYDPYDDCSHSLGTTVFLREDVMRFTQFDTLVCDSGFRVERQAYTEYCVPYSGQFPPPRWPSRACATFGKLLSGRQLHGLVHKGT